MIVKSLKIYHLHQSRFHLHCGFLINPSTIDIFSLSSFHIHHNMISSLKLLIPLLLV